MKAQETDEYVKKREVRGTPKNKTYDRNNSINTTIRMLLVGWVYESTL